MTDKKTKIIIIAIIALLFLALIVFLVLNSRKAPEEKTIWQTIFPKSKERPFSPQTPPQQPAEPGKTEPITQPERNLIQLTDTEVSGAVFHKESQKIRYIEKSTGYLYEIGSRGEERKQLTISTIPKIFEVKWSDDGDYAALKYFEDSENGLLDSAKIFLAEFPATSTEKATTTKGAFLPLDTLDLAVSPTGNRIFYLLDGNPGRGIITSFSTQRPKQIFQTSFTEYLLDWPKDDLITLLTKPSASVPGYFYGLNPKTGKLTRFLGDIAGLTAVHSPLNSKILYGKSKDKEFETEIYDANTKNSSNLALKTLPEKCLFSKTEEDKIYCAMPKAIPAGEYPDDWYKGKVSFSDALWKINLTNGSAKIILDPEDLDIVNLFTDSDENFLFFQNKKDGTLWSLKISTSTENEQD
jgi:hypothetical protein